MEENEKIINVRVEDIIPNRFQPRLAFDEQELNSLADSIRRYGIIQPLVLRNIGSKYEIIAGERRYKASLLAGLKSVPAIIKNTDDNTSSEIALLENLQRKNLTVIEEAQSYKKLIDKNYTQEEIAKKLGVSQSSIANKLRLLSLPKEVQDALLHNKISERHARSLLSLNDSNLQVELLNRIVNERLTVRQTEEEISKLLNKSTIDNDIPVGLMKFLEQEMQKETESAENKIDHISELNKPEVVNIDDMSNDIPKENQIHEENKEEQKEESLNPYQTEFENNIRKIDEQIQNQKDSSYYDEIINNAMKDRYNFSDKEPEKHDEYNDENHNDIEEQNNVLEENKKITLPNMISKVRELVSDLNKANIITTQEMDLPDKYKIVIEIDKSARD